MPERGSASRSTLDFGTEHGICEVSHFPWPNGPKFLSPGRSESASAGLGSLSQTPCGLKGRDNLLANFLPFPPCHKAAVSLPSTPKFHKLGRTMEPGNNSQFVHHYQLSRNYFLLING